MVRKHPIASVYLEPHTLADLDRVASCERRSRSNLIGVLVAEGLARRVDADALVTNRGALSPVGAAFQHPQATR